VAAWAKAAKAIKNYFVKNFILPIYRENRIKEQIMMELNTHNMINKFINTPSEELARTVSLNSIKSRKSSKNDIDNMRD
jgi:hypothetical protein